MRTVVVSDLHLGARNERHVLRLAEPRRRLAERLERADQVVLLGDVVELRGLPARQALARSTEALAAIGEAAGDARIVVVPGNHDHRIVGEWIDARRHAARRRPLTVAQEVPIGRSGLGARLARALGAGELVVSYPGYWIRPDVFATHGHHLDAHNTTPTLEVIAIAATARIAGGLPAGPLSPEQYEGILSPIYAFDHELAQGLEEGPGMWGTGASLGIWKRMRPGGDGDLPVRLLGGAALGGVLAALNRAGLGPFERDLSPVAIRTAALRAMATVVERLEVEADHVIFGHTHRPGPLPHDDEGEGWRTKEGRRLWNSGSWVREPALLRSSGRRGAYWPGACIAVDDEGPPRLEQLLDDVPVEELRRSDPKARA